MTQLLVTKSPHVWKKLGDEWGSKSEQEPSSIYLWLHTEVYTKFRFGWFHSVTKLFGTGILHKLVSEEWGPLLVYILLPIGQALFIFEGFNQRPKWGSLFQCNKDYSWFKKFHVSMI